MYKRIFIIALLAHLMVLPIATAQMASPAVCWRDNSTITKNYEAAKNYLNANQILGTISIGDAKSVMDYCNDTSDTFIVTDSSQKKIGAIKVRGAEIRYINTRRIRNYSLFAAVGVLVLTSLLLVRSRKTRSKKSMF